VIGDSPGSSHLQRSKDAFAEDPGAADLKELVWRVLRERGHKG
jgi:hypothetical protein